MPLKITTAEEPIKVDNICFTIYSNPGLGKTSLSFTANKPLLLDFDRGSYRAVERKDVVEVSSWADVAHITAADVADYDTIILDTVGKALESLTADIIRANPKLSYGGALNQQGWGQLGVRFGAFLRHMKSLKKDVILIAHMDETKDGDAIRERLKIPGGSKDLVLTDSDVIARISIVNKERMLVFSPTETSFGKDPAAIGDMILPDAASPPFVECLSGIIDRIKERLNALSDAQVNHKQEIAWFRDKLPQITTAAELNLVLGRAKQAGRDVAKMVVDRAAALEFDYDPEERGYVDPTESGEDAA